jgi:hypothetical protein
MFRPSSPFSAASASVVGSASFRVESCVTDIETTPTSKVLTQKGDAIPRASDGRIRGLCAPQGGWVNGLHGFLALIILLTGAWYFSRARRELGIGTPGAAT